jgi:hypothetical protein
LGLPFARRKFLKEAVFENEPGDRSNATELRNVGGGTAFRRKRALPYNYFNRNFRFSKARRRAFRLFCALFPPIMPVLTARFEEDGGSREKTEAGGRRESGKMEERRRKTETLDRTFKRSGAKKRF